MKYEIPIECDKIRTFAGNFLINAGVRVGVKTLRKRP